MKWLSITAVFILVTLAKSVPTKRNGDVEPESVTITKIERTAKEIPLKSSETFKFEFSGASTTDVKTCWLEVFSYVNEQPVPSDDCKATSATFKTTLTDYSENNVNFLIQGLDDTFIPLAFGAVDLTPFPMFPNVAESHAFTGSQTDPVVLRVEGDMGTMSFEDGTRIAQTNYYSFTSDDKYVPFIKVNDISVYDMPLDPKTVSPDADPIMNSAILSYQSPTDATIKFSFSDEPTVLDVIFDATDPAKRILCNAETERTNPGSLQCPIKGNFPGSDTQTMIFVKKTGNDESAVWATNRVAIQDRELFVNKLGDTIIEGRWAMYAEDFTDTSTVKQIYRLTKRKDGDETDDEAIDVDCSHLSTTPNLCFGYFPNLEGSHTYTLIVAPKISEPTSYNEMKQVESIPLKIPPPETKLKILSRHTTRQRSLQKTDVKICFEHLTPPEGRSFSHYEMLIINEKGQWLKHRIIEEGGGGEEGNEGGLCFAPFTISTKDFDLTEGTKVVVSQRGVDGVTVLATAESPLF